MRTISLGTIAVVAGSSAIGIVLATYYFATLNIVLGPESDALLTPGAEATLTAFAIGLLLVMVGVHLLFRERMRQIQSGGRDEISGVGSWLSTLTIILCDASYNILFIASTIMYGIVFGFFSGTLVYQGFPSLSDQYSVNIPSSLLVTCCDRIGQTPRLVIYLTDHLGILVVPSNIILLAATSWLVGANIALAVYAYRLQAGLGLKWLGSFGAMTGLFTACPTCASLIFLGGASGGEALAALLVPAQALLIAATDALLLGNMVLMSRRIASAKVCRVPLNSPPREETEIV